MQNCLGLSRPFHGLTQAGRPQPGTGDIWTLSQPQATVEPALCLPSGVEHSGHLALQGALMMDEREGPAAGLSQGSEGHFPDSSSGATPLGQTPAALSLGGEQMDSKDQSRAMKSLCDGGQAFQPRVQPGCSVFTWLAFVTC